MWVQKYLIPKLHPSNLVNISSDILNYGGFYLSCRAVKACHRPTFENKHVLNDICVSEYSPSSCTVLYYSTDGYLFNELVDMQLMAMQVAVAIGPNTSANKYSHNPIQTV